MNFIENAEKLKKLLKISIVMCLLWVLFMILFFVFYSTALTSTIYNGFQSVQNVNNLTKVAYAFLFIFLIFLIIEFVLVIICLVKSITLENSNDTNVLVSSDFSTLKIVAILSIFFGGFVLNIVAYFLVKGLIEKAKKGPIVNTSQNYGNNANIVNPNNKPNNDGNNNLDKFSKLSQAAELYKQGLITEEEFKKIKEETL